MGDRAWSLLDERALFTLDTLRDIFGPITVNDWMWGGRFSERGLRTQDGNTGSKYSQHRFGRAIDCIFKDTTAEEVREYIFSNPDMFPHIRGVELGTSWLHFDIGNRFGNGIYTFNH